MYHYYTKLFEGMLCDVQDRIVCSCFAWPARPLIHSLSRTKGMTILVSLERCFENGVVAT